MAAHANVSSNDVAAMTSTGTRAKASGGWIGKIMKTLLNVGGAAAQRFGGGWGKVIGTGMQIASNAFGNNASDNYTGSV
jgi:hypothetical protein